MTKGSFWKPEIDYELVEQIKLRNREDKARGKEELLSKGYRDVTPDMSLDEAMVIMAHNRAIMTREIYGG